VRLQAAMQAFVDNSLSKTVNSGDGHRRGCGTAYLLAWDGLQGITVYVTGSRQKVVLKRTPRQEKQAPAESAAGGG
jgi:ribonucleoside-diphosphate reductase alpha chain